MPNVLRQFQHHLPDFFIIQKISHAGDAMPHGFDWGYKVLVHNGRIVHAGGIPPQLKPIHSQESFKEVRIGGGNVPNGMDAIVVEFGLLTLC